MQGPKSVKAKNVFEIMAAEFLTAMIRGDNRRRRDAASGRGDEPARHPRGLRHAQSSLDRRARQSDRAARGRRQRPAASRPPRRRWSASSRASCRPANGRRRIRTDVAGLVADDMKTSAEQVDQRLRRPQPRRADRHQRRTRRRAPRPQGLPASARASSRRTSRSTTGSTAASCAMRACCCRSARATPERRHNQFVRAFRRHPIQPMGLSR